MPTPYKDNAGYRGILFGKTRDESKEESSICLDHVGRSTTGDAARAAIAISLLVT